MKNKLVLFCCIFVLLCSSSVFAADGYDASSIFDGLYIRGNIGSSNLSNSKLTSSAVPGVEVDIEFDEGLGFSIALGDDTKDHSRVELELGYHSYDIVNFQTAGTTVSGTGDITILSLLINGFLDIKTDWGISPYIGGGIGYAKIDIDNVSVAGISISGNDDEFVWAWQVSAGVGYPINDKVTVDLGYRYFETQKPDFSGVRAECDTNSFMAGIRYAFK